MSVRWLFFGSLLWVASTLSLPGQARAQTVALTPTFQTSVSRYDQVIPGSEFEALGFMVGLDRATSWWKPHLWFQRYQIKSVRRESFPTEVGNEISGWMLSVGPAIEFVENGGWYGQFMPLVGLGSVSSGDVHGGAGFHFGFDGGFFQPQLFGRYQTLGPNWFWTLGIGATLEVTWQEVFAGEELWG